MSLQIKTDLPEVFKDFGEARREGFLAVKEIKDKGQPVVGAYCTYIPEELVLAAGAVMVGLCSTTDESIDDAEEDLPRNLCPLIKSSYGMAKMDKCPYFHFSDLVVGETTCDGKTKMYEYMQEFSNMYLMQLPRFRKDENSKKLWYNELLRLKDKLEDSFDAEITDEKVREAIRQMNRFRVAKKNFYDLGKANPSVLTGNEIFSMIFGSQYKFDREETIQTLAEATAAVKARQEAGQVLDDRPRILITGSPMGGVTTKVIDAIEENGGRVVAFENCSVSKAVEELVDENEPDIYKALADKYINIGCACSFMNHTRIELIDRMIDEYQVDGVVDMVLTNCAPFAIESLQIKSFCTNEKDTPYLLIETDYSQSDIGQLNTRVTAFLEMLEDI